MPKNPPSIITFRWSCDF